MTTRTHTFRGWPMTRGWLIALALIGSAAPSHGAEPVPDLFEPLVGQAFIVDIPEELGARFPRPRRWNYLQAESVTIDALREILETPVIPAVGYFDEHANLIFLDIADTCRSASRVRASLKEFQQRLGWARNKLKSLDEGAREARERNKPAREIQHLLAIADLGLRGYAEVLAAEKRWVQLRRERRRQFLAVMAQEGLVSRRVLERDLKRLLASVTSLPIEKKIRRQLHLLEKNIGVLR